MDSDKIVNSGRISCGNKWRLDGAKTHRLLEVSLCRRKSITWMITSVLVDQPKTGAALGCGPPAGSSPLDPIRRWNLSAKLICFNSHPQITFHCGLGECLGRCSDGGGCGGGRVLGDILFCQQESQKSSELVTQILFESADRGEGLTL